MRVSGTATATPLPLRRIAASLLREGVARRRGLVNRKARPRLLRRVVVVVHVHRVLDGAAHCQGAIVVGGGERERREALGRVFDRVVPASGRAGGGKVSDRLGARRRVLCADDRRLADKLIEWSRAERRVGLGSFDVRAAQVL